MYTNENAIFGCGRRGTQGENLYKYNYRKKAYTNISVYTYTSIITHQLLVLRVCSMVYVYTFNCMGNCVCECKKNTTDCLLYMLYVINALKSEVFIHTQTNILSSQKEPIPTPIHTLSS